MPLPFPDNAYETLELSRAKDKASNSYLILQSGDDWYVKSLKKIFHLEIV